MNIVLRFIPLFFMVAALGCSKNGEIESALKEYKDTGNTAKAYEVLEDLRYMLTAQGLSMRGYLHEDEKKPLTEMANVALSKEDYELYVAIYETTQNRINDQDMKIISDHYKKNNPSVNDLIAKWNIRKGMVKSGFRRLEVAAIHDHRFADEVRYMLRLYGCTDAHLIWAELSNSNYTYMADYTTGGDEYPSLPRTLDNSELVDLRIKLRNGSIPKLNSNCPILKYD